MGKKISDSDNKKNNKKGDKDFTDTNWFLFICIGIGGLVSVFIIK